MNSVSIKGELTKFVKKTMRSENPRMNGWYSGITNNENRRKAEHKRKKGEILHWKCINAGTMKKANEVEKYFSSKGTINMPNPNGAIITSRWVYIFKLPLNRGLGLNGVLTKEMLFNEIFGE